MNERRRRPARLEIGQEVVRTPETIFEEAHGKAIRRPMRGRVDYIHPRGGGSISWLSRCAGKPSKKPFKVWRYRPWTEKRSF